MATKKNKFNRVVIVPTYNRLEFLKPCLRNLAMMCDEWDQLIIVDNGSKEETRSHIKEWISEFETSRPNTINVLWQEENVGKAKSVNTAVDTYVNDESIICSLDSDIMVYALTLQYCFRIIEQSRTPMILCAQQDGDNCHRYSPNGTLQMMDLGDRVKQEIIHAPNGRGVAGGCMFIKSNTFKHMGGYDTSMGIYGGNEMGLYVKFSNRKYGIFVAKDLMVFHPFEDDAKYQEWKEECQDNIRASGTCGKEKGFYEQNN